MTPSFKITHQKRINKNTLIGVFDLELPSRLKINGFMLLEKNGKRWFGFPSREWVKPDGAQELFPAARVSVARVSRSVPGNRCSCERRSAPGAARCGRARVSMFPLLP